MFKMNDIMVKETQGKKQVEESFVVHQETLPNF